MSAEDDPQEKVHRLLGELETARNMRNNAAGIVSSLKNAFGLSNDQIETIWSSCQEAKATEEQFNAAETALRNFKSQISDQPELLELADQYLNDE
jgi:hypothetical protein